MPQSLEQEIQQYLPMLGNEEKRSVLSVIKLFISLKSKAAHVDAVLSEKQLQLVEAERAKHLSGKSQSYSWEDAQSIIRKK